LCRKLLFVTKPRECVVPWEIIVASGLHLHFCRDRETAKFTRKTNEFLDQHIFVISRLQLVGFKSSLSNGITPPRPNLTYPIGLLDAGLLRKPPFAESYTAISCGGTLDLAENVLFVHDDWICAAST
jgi:hypothetical protein